MFRTSIGPLSGPYTRAEQLAPFSPVPGEVHLRLGRAGHGKTADLFCSVPAFARHGVVLVAHTEDTTGSYVRGCGLNSAGVNRSVASNVRIRAIESDGRHLVEFIYEAVAAGIRRRAELPLVLVVDTADALVWPGQNCTASIDTTADLLEAAAELDIVEIGHITGYTWADWCGDEPPHIDAKMAVVAYGQMSKRSMADADLFGDPANLARSARLASVAASVLVFDRAKPLNNPWVDQPCADGRAHLSDIAARFIVHHDGDTTVVPMVFDLDPDGFRARWFDVGDVSGVQRRYTV